MSYRIKKLQLAMKVVGSMTVPTRKVTSPTDVVLVAQSELKDSPVEVMLLIGLASDASVVGLTRIATIAAPSKVHLCTVGLLRAALAMPLATGFAIAHNHPSGNHLPSV